MSLVIDRVPLSPDRRVSFTIVREDQTQFWVTSLPLPNTPHHLAGVYDFDQSRLRLYVDGQLADETIVTGRLRNYGNDLFIGDWNGSSSWHFHHGEMDEVRLWNVARSEADIRREMRFQLVTNEPGLVAYWAFDEASGTTALDQAPGGSHGTLVNGPLRLASPVPRFAPVLATNSGPAQITVTLQGSDPDNDPITAHLTQLPAFGSLFQTADGVTPAAAITTVSTAVTSPSRQVIYRRLPGYTGIDELQYFVNDGQTNSETATVSLDVVAPSGEAQCMPVPPGIVAWWKGDDTATDSVGTNHGTLTNGATYTAGVAGAAFSFDGNGYLRVGENSELVASNALTVDCWIYPTGLGGGPVSGGMIVNKEDQYEICRFADGSIRWAVANAVPGFAWVNSGFFAPSNQWTHLSWSYDSGTAKLYANGVLVQTYQGQGWIGSTPGSTNHEFWIGGRQSEIAPYTRFQGRIDEVALWKRALSETEVTAVHAAGAAGMCFGRPVINQHPASTNVAVGDVAGFTVMATGALPMGYQWQFNTTNLPSATNSAFSLQPSALSDSGGYRVVVSNAGGAVTSLVATLTVTNPICTPPPAGLVAWWKAEGNANDTVGGNSGSLASGAAFAQGRVGQTFNLDGSASAYVSVPYSPAFAFGTNAFTLEAWIKTTNSTATIACDYGCDARRLFYITGGLLTCNLGESTDWHELVVTGTTLLNDDRFHHVAFVRDMAAKELRLFVDGRAETTAPLAPYADGFLGRQSSCTTPVLLGAHFMPPSSTVWPLSGCIDELAIYHRALTSNEIASLYAGGSAGKCVAYQPCPPSDQRLTNSVIRVIALDESRVSACGPMNINFATGESYQSLRGALLNTANFGPSGVVRKTVVILPAVSLLTREALQQADMVVWS